MKDYEELKSKLLDKYGYSVYIVVSGAGVKKELFSITELEGFLKGVESMSEIKQNSRR